MLRDAPTMIRDPLRYLSAAVAQHGDFIAFPMPRTPVVLVNAPDAAHRVLVQHHRRYSKRTVQYDTLGIVTGDGLLVSDPPRWTSHRRTMQPAFHHERLDAVARYSVLAAERVVQEWLRSGPAVLDVDEAMMHAALQVVGAALFSTDLTGQAERIVQAVLTSLDHVVVRARSPWLPPLSVPTPGNLRLRRALGTIDEAVAGIVAERRRRADPGEDMLGLLLTAGLTDREVRDEVVTLLIAGHETVASALTWTWYLLAQHPDQDTGLAAELDEVCPQGPPTFADLPRLRRTRAVLDEALRLYPPAWVLSRRAIEEDELAGFAVPAGSIVLISPYTLHRHPELWPDPLTFSPQRWHGETPRWAYLPFGAGPRLCIGRDFALVEGTLMLATIARRLSVALPAGRPRPRVDALVTLRPRGGLPMLLSPR